METNHACVLGNDGTCVGDGNTDCISPTATILPLQSVPSSNQFAFHGMMHPHFHPYASVQQVDDPHLWQHGTLWSSCLLTPPTLRPPLLMPPPHQHDDPRMFGLADPNPMAGLESVDVTMVDVESQQGPGDTSHPNQVNEPMHDAHAEVDLRQRPDN